MTNQNQTAPVAFISYSHDSPNHKIWVAKLATALMENGVEVILDQWDLSLGDDIAKFMERGISRSSKVLMICTESYVSKVNDGQGGAGFEAMIVSGELVKDLGTSKFIPIIRQNSESPVLPTVLGARYYVNMSIDDGFDQSLKLLLHELHKVPVIEKPKLGKNPFGVTPAGEDVPKKQLSDQSEAIAPDISDLDVPKTYLQARDLIASDDIASWRRLVSRVRSDTSSDLNKYRQRFKGKSADTKEAMLEMALEASTILSPLIALGVAGVESGRTSFRHQRSLLDLIVNPREWNGSGYSRVVGLPEAAGFVYQAIHGALCVFTNQLELAIEFALSIIVHQPSGDSIPVWRNHLIMGWPTSLHVKSTTAHELIFNVYDSWGWLNGIFGEKSEFKSALLSYYLMLNTIEYADLLAHGHVEALTKKELSLDIPLNFVFTQGETCERSYQYFLENRSAILTHIEQMGIPPERAVRYWRLWTNFCEESFEKWDRFAFRLELPHRNLMRDLFPQFNSES